VEKSFVAQAGGNLYIQGNQSIDILALNHPKTPFTSGGNLSLISDGNISGDAHFSTGGDFSIRNTLGNPGKFVSLYDPIISSVGDVNFGDYTGVSLKIEAKGNITAGNIVITGADTSLIVGQDPDIPILSSTPALILRAGVTNLENPPNFGSSSYSITNLGTLPGGNLSNASDINNNGQVVGVSNTANGNPSGVVWQNGTIQNLGTLPGNDFSSANAINDAGVAVGNSGTFSGNLNAVVWQNGAIQNIGNNSVQANDINNLAQVVGITNLNGNNQAFLWQNGAIQNLGTLPAMTSAAPIPLTTMVKLLAVRVQLATVLKLYCGKTALSRTWVRFQAVISATPMALMMRVLRSGIRRQQTATLKLCCGEIARSHSELYQAITSAALTTSTTSVKLSVVRKVRTRTLVLFSGKTA
jgi:probable HAF family extracellular repeat protein